MEASYMPALIKARSTRLAKVIFPILSYLSLLRRCVRESSLSFASVQALMALSVVIVMLMSTVFYLFWKLKKERKSSGATGAAGAATAEDRQEMGPLVASTCSEEEGQHRQWQPPKTIE